jgi:hypothetical protein
MDEDDDRDRRERKGRWAPNSGSGRRFKAMVDFDRGPFSYAEGLSYTADSSALDELLDQWLEEGLVVTDRIGAPQETQPAIVGGNGTVKDGDR